MDIKLIFLVKYFLKNAYNNNHRFNVKTVIKMVTPTFGTENPFHKCIHFYY